MIKKILITIILLSFLSYSSYAQALQFVKSEIDPVSVAMGGVSALYESSAYSAFGNTSVLPMGGKKLDVAMSYSDMQPNGTRVRGASVGGSLCVFDNIGVSVAFYGGRNLPYEIVGDDGQISGSFSPSDYMASIGAAYRFGSFLSVGLNAGYAASKLSMEKSYGAIVSDIFVTAELAGARLVLGVEDLGTFVKSANNRSYKLPTSIIAGAAYKIDLSDNYKMALMLESEFYAERAFSLSVGGYCNFYDVFEIRSGYRYGELTMIPSYWSMGFGLNFTGIGLNCSYILPLLDNRLSGTWAVGLEFSISCNE